MARPGLAPIAGSLAVELMASVLQHPLGVDAPAAEEDPPVDLPLGHPPHMVRNVPFMSPVPRMLCLISSLARALCCQTSEVLPRGPCRCFRLLLLAADCLHLPPANPHQLCSCFPGGNPLKTAAIVFCCPYCGTHHRRRIQLPRLAIICAPVNSALRCCCVCSDPYVSQQLQPTLPGRKGLQPMHRLLLYSRG